MILAGLGRFYGWSRAELEALTIEDILFWNEAAHGLMAAAKKD